MAQYLISVLTDTAELATAEEDGRDRCLQRASSRPTATGSSPAASRRPARPPSSTAATARRYLTDGPFVETKEYVAGFWIIEAPDLDVALRLATQGSKACNRRVEVRPIPATAMTDVDDGDRPGPPRGVGPGGRDPGQALRGPRHRRGDGRRGVRDRRRALAGRRRPAQSRRVAHHHRQPQGHRPAPARGQARGQAQGGADAVRHPGAARRHRRRPAPPRLHLLPSRARHGGAGRADPADGRRAHRARDRPRVPGPGDRHGPADHPGQGEDQGGQDPLSRAVSARTSRPGSPGCSPSST